MKTIKGIAALLAFVMAVTAATGQELETATTLANAAAFSTRLRLSGANVKAVCTAATSQCVTRRNQYTAMKNAIDALVGCLTSSRVAQQCSTTATVATIETSRYVDLVDITRVTSERTLVAAVPLFVELVLLLARHHATASHRRLTADVRTLTGRRSTDGAQAGKSSSEPDPILVHLNDVRVPDWSDL